MKTVTVRQALQHVADYPHPLDDEVIQTPVWELVARNLYDLANRPDAAVRGSMARANRARRIILNRMVGKRRAGSRPAVHTEVEVEFIDLDGKEITR